MITPTESAPTYTPEAFAAARAHLITLTLQELLKQWTALAIIARDARIQREAAAA